MTRTFDGVSIDVGGVFCVPNHQTLIDTLASAGLEVDDERLWDGHYRAMHAVDEAGSPAETFGDYVPALCHHLGFRGPDHDRAVQALDPLFGPSGLWSTPIEQSVRDLALLADAGVPIVVLSNADGTIAEHLVQLEICQVGEGALVEVDGIVDSGLLGVAKPDERIFAEAVAVLGLPHDRVVHVGDSVHYDVEGALAAGLQACHFDPQRLCERTDHDHVRRLADLLDGWPGSRR